MVRVKLALSLCFYQILSKEVHRILVIFQLNLSLYSHIEIPLK